MRREALSPPVTDGYISAAGAEILMHGTPNEIAVAHALAAATAEEQRKRSSGDPERSTPAEIASAALLRLRDDQEATASFIKDVVIADEDDPIPYAALVNGSDREVVCIDLTDGGTVWCYDLDGEPRWLPEAEFQRWADEDDATTLPLATALIIFFASIIAVAVLLAFWFSVLPSSGK
jgi:hypothetical protein